MYQQSIYQAQIPSAWKQAKVVALYKGKDEKTDSSSYRGISLTYVASKVLERIVEQVRNFLINNSLIGEEQHGYMPKRSVATNLLQCNENIARNLNANEPCDLILLDFTRAFDKISHDILKIKLNALGITGNLYQWLADFLKNRTQFVVW